jgi:hypothetical protein
MTKNYSVEAYIHTHMLLTTCVTLLGSNTLCSTNTSGRGYWIGSYVSTLGVMQSEVWFDSPHTGNIIQLPTLTSYCKAISASAAAGVTTASPQLRSDWGC